MLTRRLFMAASTGSLVCAVIPPTAAATLATGTQEEPAINHVLEATCDVYQGGERVAQMDIVAVEQSFTGESRLVQYIFNFESTVAVCLPEATYQVSHPTLGQLDLFLQTCGGFSADRHDGIQYRACMGMLRTV